MFAIVVVVVVVIMRVIFSLDVYYLVPLCMLANIALDAGFDCCCGDPCMPLVLRGFALTLAFVFAFALSFSLPCQGQNILLSCWSRGSQIYFIAVFLIYDVR